MTTRPFPDNTELTKHLVIVNTMDDDDAEPNCLDLGVLYLTDDRVRWCVNKRIILDMTWEQWALATTSAIGGALHADRTPPQ